MSNVTRLPPFSKTVRVEAEIPVSQRDEFDRAMVEIIAGERPRMDALDQDLGAIKLRAVAALQIIAKAIHAVTSHYGRGKVFGAISRGHVQRPGLPIRSERIARS